MEALTIARIAAAMNGIVALVLLGALSQRHTEKDKGRVEDSQGIAGALRGAIQPDELEPLTDANDLVSWESMRGLWLPEQYRVVA